MRKRQMTAMLLAAGMMIVQMQTVAMAAITIDGVPQESSVVTISGDVNLTSTTANGIVADAAGDQVTITGAVNSVDNGINVMNGASASAGSVNADPHGGIAVQAVGKNSSVTVKGDIVGGGIAISANNGAEVTAGSAVGDIGGVQAGDAGTTVTVSGKVSGGGMSGVAARDGAAVSVGSASGSPAGVSVKNNSTVTVAGDSDGDEAGIIVAGADGKVTVGGNVSGGSESVWLQDEMADGGVKNAEVLILGNAGGSIHVSTSEERLTSLGSEDALAKELGKVVVGSITPAEGEELVTVSDSSRAKTALTEAEKTAIADAVAQNTIYYIVNTEKVNHGTITVTKASNVIEVKDADGNALKDKNGSTLYAANRTQTVSVQIVAADGYEVKSTDGGKATLTKNEDGSYTLTVPEGGGIDISDVISAIYRDSNDDGNGGGSTSVNVTYADGTQKTFTVKGWQQNGSIWSFVNNGGTLLKNCWAKLTWNGTEDWYSFDENGVMRTGWYEENGKKYYLNPVSDGYRGKMMTGEQMIDGKTFRFAGSGELEA